MVLALFALLVSAATGWAALACIWPHAQNHSLELVLRSAVAGGIGLFMSSVIYFACLAMDIAERPWVISLDLAALTGLALLARRCHRSAELLRIEDQDLDDATRGRTIDWVLGFGLLTALMINAKAWLARYGDEPLGFWDAFAIWNLKARFFFLESGEHWRRAFSDTISWSHTDYPLLLPLNVARLWTYGASPDHTIPAILSVCFVLLIVALLYGAVRATQGRTMAYFAVFALLATHSFMRQVAWQLADIPLGYFLATSLALVVASHRQKDASSRLLVVAGLSAGAAAWTKNEGLLFALALPLALFLTDAGPGIAQRLQRALQYAMGLTLPLTLLLVMKLCVGGESDLASDFSIGSLERIFDLARHREIVVSFAQTLLRLTHLPLLLLIAGLCSWWALKRRNRGAVSIATVMLALSFQLSGYYFIYLITERDLAWHLDTSNLRLFVQLWPSVLLVLFVGLPSFADEVESTKPIQRLFNRVG